MNWNHIALDFYLVIVARYILIVNLSRIHLLKRVSVSAQAWRFKPMIKQAPFSFNIPRNPWDQLICRRPRISQNTTFRKTGLVKLWLTFDSLQEATTILEWVQRLSKLKCQSWIYYLDYKHTVFIFDQVTFAWEWVYTPSLPPLSPPTSWICLSMTSFGVDLLFPSEIWIWIVFVSLSDLCSTNQM